MKEQDSGVRVHREELNEVDMRRIKERDEREGSSLEISSMGILLGRRQSHVQLKTL